jgi:hypothetical protein
MQGEDGKARWWESLGAAVMRGAVQGLGIKFGPGVLGTIVPINTVGVIALAGITWALSAHPYLAVVADGGMLLFLVYVNERAFRYAQKDPVTALLGGSELYQLLKDQSAKDKSIVVDSTPIEGAGSAVIEGKAERIV